MRSAMAMGGGIAALLSPAGGPEETAVHGRFRGGGEHVEVIQYGSSWHLKGGSQQTDVMAYAQCLMLHE